MGALKFIRIYSLDAGFEASRMIVGGLSAMYLLSKGIDASQLALIKVVQATFSCWVIWLQEYLLIVADIRKVRCIDPIFSATPSAFMAAFISFD